MKAKKKFDPKVMQQFFVDHTEKIVVGLVAVLFLYFAYTSATLQGYDKKPPDLTERDGSRSRPSSPQGPR